MPTHQENFAWLGCVIDSVVTRLCHRLGYGVDSVLLQLDFDLRAKVCLGNVIVGRSQLGLVLRPIFLVLFRVIGEN